MRDRLIEWIQSAVGGCSRYWAELIADHLLAEGVLVPNCKLGYGCIQCPLKDARFKTNVK